MSFRAFESISAVDRLIGLAVTAAGTVIFLYKRRQAARKNVIPFPPGPPARWFWENVLPTAK
jgi:hypothetical protein